MRALTTIVTTTSLIMAGCGADLQELADNKGSGTPDTGTETGTGAGTTTDPADYTPESGSTMATGAMVVKGCRDGDYGEKLPDLNLKINDLVAAYDPAAAATYLRKALAKRYPAGLEVISAIDTDAQCRGFLERLGAGAWEDLDFAGTIVHECGHLLNARIAPGFDKDGFYISGKLQFVCENGPQMRRGAIMDDQFKGAVPPCGGGGGGDCDIYADDYLGELGDQNFGDLMDELTEYVHSLATAYAFHDLMPENTGTSARDGVLAFLWYMERYLRLARTSEPDEYAKLTGNSCWRDLILTTWGRAWLYLEATKSMPQLEVTGQAFLKAATKPELYAEVESIRKAAQCGP